YHNIPFYGAAPSSTFDPNCPDGLAIPIENRPADEIRLCGGRLIAPIDSPVHNPAFDITPHTLHKGIITENGIISPAK
ncbi:MAG: S-methyl-5-thioribose-1-phosphate isomerase, partial [candidate division Zixibacteria bacterium]